MKSIIFKLVILSFVLFAITGCSKGGSNPVQPDSGAANNPALRMASGRNLIGVYEIHLRSDVPGADVRINRSIQSHVNAVAEEYVDVDVLYDPPGDSEHINDYNANFGFRGWAIWDLDIDILNNTNETLYDVRGIIMINGTALGLHNADGLTTAWGNGVDPNPFIYYEDLEEYQGTILEFQVRFTPPVATLNCGDCSWESDPIPEYPEVYIPQDEWVNFAVDASVGGHCREPYSIEATAAFSGDLDEPILTVAVDAEVHPPSSYVDTISIMLFDLPGYEEDWGEWLGLSPYSSITLNGIGAQTHEGIYHARVRVTSTEPSQPDPYDDPNTMYKDIRLLVGDFDELIDDMFSTDIEVGLYLEILEDWDERKEGIYHETTDDGFYIEDYIYYGGFPHFLLIHYNVGEVEEYGVLRIPAGTPINAPGWPLMVFCHFGRAVSKDGCGEDFYKEYDHKEKFAEIIPRYRGNVLCWGGQPWEPSIYQDDINSLADYDVDDVLALLNVVIDHKADIETYIGYEPEPYTPLLDDSRVGIMGGSRGGSPTYLAKIRDSYYEKDQISRALITIGSVTDLLNENIPIATSCEKYIEYDGYVPEDTYHYYLADYNVFKRVLEPYLQGEEGVTFDEARKRLIRSSPRIFANYLGKVQVHHGLEDLLARPAQTDVLFNIFGFDSGVTEFLYYPTQYHTIDKDAKTDWPSETEYKVWTRDWLDAIGGY